ncbi:MAG: RluA family pseudouridine synthase [Anaerolineaceae bacterium]|nr:RluA family pseudouridine synthase [Anaerolineaceae bacterium]
MDDSETVFDSNPHIPESMIMYMDDDLLVVNKPAGLLSIQDGYDLQLPHLATILEPLVGKVWIIHRLDKDTSGVMLLGRNADTHRYFNEEFKKRSIEKYYHCLIAGNFNWEEMDVHSPLLKNADRLHRTRVNEFKGKAALTSFKVLQKFPNYTLVECQLFTGYTHQIRAHLFHLGLHLLGETLYCRPSERPDKQNNYGLTRFGLHSRTISFKHSSNSKRMSFTALYPRDIANLILI